MYSEGPNVTFGRERAMLKLIGGLLATALMLATLDSCGGGGSGVIVNPGHGGQDGPSLTSLSPSSVPVGSVFDVRRRSC